MSKLKVLVPLKDFLLSTYNDEDLCIRLEKGTYLTSIDPSGYEKSFYQADYEIPIYTKGSIKVKAWMSKYPARLMPSMALLFTKQEYDKKKGVGITPSEYEKLAVKPITILRLFEGREFYILTLFQS